MSTRLRGHPHPALASVLPACAWTIPQKKAITDPEPGSTPRGPARPTSSPALTGGRETGAGQKPTQLDHRLRVEVLAAGWAEHHRLVFDRDPELPVVLLGHRSHGLEQRPRLT